MQEFPKEEDQWRFMIENLKGSPQSLYVAAYDTDIEPRREDFTRIQSGFKYKSPNPTLNDGGSLIFYVSFGRKPSYGDKVRKYTFPKGKKVFISFDGKGKLRPVRGAENLVQKILPGKNVTQQDLDRYDEVTIKK